jgi:non-ribosomal peptide synthase protein (TIGR01720 family)
MGDDVETRAHLRAIPPPAVSLVYLGQLDPLCTDDSPFHLVPDASGSSHGGHGLRSHQLEVVALVVDGRLRVHWWYSENLHRCSTIVRQTGEFLARLRALVVGCQPSVQAP